MAAFDRILAACKRAGIRAGVHTSSVAYAQAMIDQVHQQFIKVVRDGRGKRLKETPETFSGLFWNGEEAVRMGLADNFGNLDHVARDVVKAEEVIDYTPKENVADEAGFDVGVTYRSDRAGAESTSLSFSKSAVTRN